MSPSPPITSLTLLTAGPNVIMDARRKSILLFRPLKDIAHIIMQWSTPGNSISPSSKTASASSPSISLPSGASLPTHSSKASSAASVASSPSAPAIPALHQAGNRHPALPSSRPRSPNTEATPSHQTQTPRKPPSPVWKLSLSRLTPCGMSKRAISNAVYQEGKSRSRTPSPNPRRKCKGCEDCERTIRRILSLKVQWSSFLEYKKCTASTCFRNLLETKNPSFPYATDLGRHLYSRQCCKHYTLNLFNCSPSQTL